MQIKNEQRLKNKVAIITGGAGGIGSTIVDQFIAEGAKVISADITKIKLKKEPRFFYCRTDIRDSASVKNLIKKTLALFGTIDILINAAAVQKPIGPLTDISEKDWINCIMTNLIGTMLCCRHVLPAMISNKKGKIINFSGGGSTFPRPNYSAYASSKAAIVRFTETLSEEVRDHGIDANSIAPGSVYTNMLKDIIQAGKIRGGKDYSGAVRIKSKGGDSPVHAANLCVYLASDFSDGITGKLISAVWDNWKGFDKNILGIKNSSLYTLRRVDGKKIIEVKNTKIISKL